MRKFESYLSDYQAISEPDTIDATEPLYMCSKCRRLSKQPFKEGCPECGVRMKWIVIPPRARKPDESKGQVTGPNDIPREKKDRDVSIANPNIYRGPQ